MGNLTDDMSRLRTEINALRIKRTEFVGNIQAFVNDLKKDTSQMRHDFRNAHPAVAPETKNEPVDFASHINVNILGVNYEYEDDEVCISQAEENTETQPLCEAKSDITIDEGSSKHTEEPVSATEDMEQKTPEIKAETIQKEAPPECPEEKTVKLKSVPIIKAKVETKAEAGVIPLPLKSKKSPKSSKRNSKQKRNKS